MLLFLMQLKASLKVLVKLISCPNTRDEKTSHQCNSVPYGIVIRLSTSLAKDVIRKAAKLLFGSRFD